MMFEESVGVVSVEEKVMSGELPQVLQCILSHLPLADIGRLSSVCSTWNRLANENHMWRALCDRYAISFQQGPLQLQQPHEQQWCYYKSVYKKYRETLRKWMTGEGVSRFSKTLKRPNGADMSGLCVAMCSQYILTGGLPPNSADSDISVYCAVTGQFSHQLSGLPRVAKHVIVSEDETVAVAESWMGRWFGGTVVCVWKIDTGELLHTFNHTDTVLTKSLRDSMLAVGVDEGNPMVCVYSIESGQLVHQLCSTHPDVLVMDDQHIAIHNHQAGIVQLWDANTGKHRFTWNHTGHCNQLLLDKATKSLVGGKRFAVYVWDTETGVCRATVAAIDGYEYQQMIITDHAALVIAALCPNAVERTLWVIGLKAAQPMQSMMQLPDARVVHDSYGLGKCVLQALGSGLVAVGGLYPGDACVTLWDMKRRRFVGKVYGPRGGNMCKVTVSFDKLQLVAESEDFRGHAQLVYEAYDFSARPISMLVPFPKN